jgi:hypothetical protein
MCDATIILQCCELTAPAVEYIIADKGQAGPSRSAAHQQPAPGSCKVDRLLVVHPWHLYTRIELTASRSILAVWSKDKSKQTLGEGNASAQAAGGRAQTGQITSTASRIFAPLKRLCLTSCRVAVRSPPSSRSAGQFVRATRIGTEVSRHRPSHKLCTCLGRAQLVSGIIVLKKISACLWHTWRETLFNSNLEHTF